MVGIATSGRTPYVLGALAHARHSMLRDRGGHVTKVAVTAAGDLPIEVVAGPEVLAGSTRLKAGTAHEDGAQHAHHLALGAAGKTTAT